MGCLVFLGVEEAGFKHEVKIMRKGDKAMKNIISPWIGIVLGNLKNALKGTYHAVHSKHVPRYLAEFQYRFNRRFKLENMIPRLAYVAVRTPPIPEKILIMAEKAW